MTEYATITAAGIIERDNNIALVVTFRGAMPVAICLEHTDAEEEHWGKHAFNRMCAALNITEIDDAEELVGRTLPLAVLERVRELARPHIPPEEGQSVYVISCADSDQPLCKIGIANDPAKRLRQLSTASPHALVLNMAIKTRNPRKVEADAHAHFSDVRRNGEWFALAAHRAMEYVRTAATARSAA